jgi:hypothetical protein
LFGGGGYIAGESPGLVTVNSVPAERELEVRHRRSRMIMRTKSSNSDGTYRIEGLDPNEEFDVIGRDYSGTYNDVIVSRVKPKAY